MNKSFQRNISNRYICGAADLVAEERWYLAATEDISDKALEMKMFLTPVRSFEQNLVLNVWVEEEVQTLI